MARFAVVMPSTCSRTSWLRRMPSLTVQARISSLCWCTQVTRCASIRPWKADTPPSVVHVVLDLLFAGVATAAAFTGDVALPDVLRDQPLLGIPFLMLLAIGCGLVFLAFSSLPKTMAAVREVAA